MTQASPDPAHPAAEGVSAGPFADLAAPVPKPDPLRARIRAATRRPETECLPPLLAAAALAPGQEAAAEDLARRLVEALRARGPGGPVAEMMHAFALSSAEGIALMCLAEALLRIPDAATRDALIRDTIGRGAWQAHLGPGRSLFANAAAWGLVLTGRLVAAPDAAGLETSLARLLRRAGEPAVRAGVDLAMRLLGNHFVAGRDIGEALAHARRWEARGFRYSYDMLGEAALTAADAARYAADYAGAIAAIGTAAGGLGPVRGPGISVKLSALHPRYGRAQRGRVLAELAPRLAALAAAARADDIGFNIDAEEADRLDLSLDLLEGLAADPELAGWNGLGFVVQAYGRRAPLVIEALVALARRTQRRLMVRLVKGAYWDTEIKRAQAEGLADFPVFTRKLHTDVCYLACARAMLAAPDAIFPQFATHNARTLASVMAMAGPDFREGDYEFQCLHGMGETLYEAVVGPNRLGRPCRIYAPVGTHETLLAYLVRRLLENGANASFVNRVADPAVPVADLVADPVAQARALEPPGAPHPAIARPRDLYPDRTNAAGFDLADEAVLAGLARDLAAAVIPTCRPLLAERDGRGATRPVHNPADRDARVGQVAETGPAELAEALAAAEAAAPGWAATPPAERALCLDRAAAAAEAEPAPLLAVLVREGGKTLPNAAAELRETIDFLRYYAGQARALSDAAHTPLGPVACISPWNFPLAIFTGQVAAALAAGNPVLAKPAEETPLAAGLAVCLLRGAGVPPAALQLLPGDGALGARIVADPRIRGVLFTGSTAVAREIAAALAERSGADGQPVPLVAETGGINAMVVDSSALPEQVVADVIASAFDSAGQRCSALRLLCLQEEVADRILAMLKGAMAELALGDPARLATDVGPVISAPAQAAIAAHVARMRARGHAVHAPPLPAPCAAGHFVAPTLIAVESPADLDREVFGPVLHVLRFPRTGLDALMADIAATGYGLTFGVHSRVEATVARLVEGARAGNLYVNRTTIGAVVGVQPFGGEGLSGTGPKAGGPLYLRRLLRAAPPGIGPLPGARPPEGAAAPGPPAALLRLREALLTAGRDAEAARCARYAAHPLVGLAVLLPGPVGEANRYSLHPRGRVLCLPESETGLAAQAAAALAAGNELRIHGGPDLRRFAESLGLGNSWSGSGDPAACAAILVEGDPARVAGVLRAAAAQAGPVIPVFALSRDALTRKDYPLHGLVRERSLSTNTAAAGGNAALLALA